MGKSAADRDMTMTQHGNDQIMTHHTVVLDGAVWSVWRCTRCGRELGRFGAGMPEVVADCTPRRWGDGAVA